MIIAKRNLRKHRHPSPTSIPGEALARLRRRQSVNAYLDRVCDLITVRPDEDAAVEHLLQRLTHLLYVGGVGRARRIHERCEDKGVRDRRGIPAHVGVAAPEVALLAQGMQLVT